MTKKLLTCLAVLLSTTNLGAQMSMPPNVLPDRVMIADQWVPRRLELPSVLQVPAGQTVTLAATSTFDYIEVAGILQVAPNTNTTLSFTHMIILPGGLLNVSTACGFTTTLIVRDVPIDTGKDPWQWGNGIVNFGRETRVGCKKTDFLPTAGPLKAGDKIVALQSAPSGWRVGDELLIPPSKKPPLPTRHGDGSITLNEQPKEATVHIASISGSVVTLDKGLDFDHPDLARPDGSTVLHPRVANLTRNIVVKSQNPLGTRGHSVEIGDSASWDLEANRVEGMGRTKATPLDVTTADKNGVITHVGTQQIAKYATHMHHVSSAVGSIYDDMVLIGDDLTKWGLSVHATSDAIISNSVCAYFAGACIVTEDGDEVRDQFLHNLVVGSVGKDLVTGMLNNPTPKIDLTDFQINCPGCPGLGFWFHGVDQSVFRGNEAWANGLGYDIFQISPTGSYASKPGGMVDTPINVHTMTPAAWEDNIGAVNVFSDLQEWGTTRFARLRSILTCAGSIEADFPISDGNVPYFVDSIFLGCGGTGLGIDTSIGYTGFVQVVGGEMRGLAVASAGGAGRMMFKNVTFQNPVNLDFTQMAGQQTSELENNTFVPWPGQPILVSVVFGRSTAWAGPPAPLPVVGVAPFAWSQGSRHLLKNWGGTGQDFRLVVPQQVGANPGWPSQGSQYYFANCPADNLTMQQCWDRYGVGYNGETVSDTATSTLAGVWTWDPTSGVPPMESFGGAFHPETLVAFKAGVAGLVAPLGSPKAIVTWPRAGVAATVVAGQVPIYITLTGDLAKSQPSAFVSIDGGVQVSMALQTTNDTIVYSGPSTPGAHTIDAWRPNPDGSRNDATKTSWTYDVNGSTPPPPTPVAVPSVVGMTPALAAAALTAAGLVPDLPTTMVTTDPAKVGLIVQQTPAAGQMEVPGTHVALIAGVAPPPPTTATVPALVGLSQSQAVSAVTGVGLPAPTVTTASSTSVRAGIVISQSAPAGTSVPLTTVISIVVSSGPPSPTPQPVTQCVFQGTVKLGCVTLQ